MAYRTKQITTKVHTGCSVEQVGEFALMTCSVLQVLRCQLCDSSQVSELSAGVANIALGLKVTCDLHCC